MKKNIKLILYNLVILFIISTAILSFLISTNTGLYASLHIANWLVPGKLTVKKATGTLLSTWQLEETIYNSNELDFKIDNINIDWRLMKLFAGQLVVKKGLVGHIQINSKLIKTSENQLLPTGVFPNLSLELPFRLHIDNLSIKELIIDKYSLSNIRLKLNIDNAGWKITKMSFDTLDKQIKIMGDLDLNNNFATDIVVKTKSLNQRGISGEFSIKGDWANYSWQGYTTTPIAILTNGHIKKANAVNGQAKWQPFTLPGKHKTQIRVSAGELLFKGNFNKLMFYLNTALIHPARTKINASGYFGPQDNEAVISIKQPNQGNLNIKIHQDKKQNPTKTTVKIRGNRLNLTPYRLPITQLNLQAKVLGSNVYDLMGDLTANGLYRNIPISLKFFKTSQKLKGEASLANNRFSIMGENPFPLSIRASIPSPQLIVPTLKGLNTHLNLNGKFNSLTSGHTHLSIQPGNFTHPKDQSIPPISFLGGNYTLTLTEQGLEVLGKLEMDKQKTLMAKVNFPKLSLDTTSLKQQTLTGRLYLHINSLDFVRQLTPHILDASGKINGDLMISGKVANPKINGKLELTGGSFKTQTSKQPFQPVTASITTNTHHWNLQSTINHQGSQLILNGSGQFIPQLNGLVKVSGNNFLAMDNKEFLVFISPNVSINLSPNKTELTGELTIPKARIQPQTFSSTVALPEDVEFTDEKENKPAKTFFRINLLINMGEDVRLLIEGLRAKIIGSVRLQKLSGGELTSSGQLSVADGKYQAYGQKLDISQGELLFAGGAINNPGVNIRATRTFNTTGRAFSGSNRLFDFGASNIQTMSFANRTTVGIQVSGRLKTPKISLFSEPSNLQQSDILSMLILGRPAGQAAGASGELLLSAITNMGLDRGTQGGQLLSQLQNKLGLEFSANSSTTYDPQQDEVSDTHSVGVKKKFSDRLSLGYNVGIYDSNSTVLTLTYMLNKFFSIQVNANSDASGIDLTYTRSKN